MKTIIYQVLTRSWGNGRLSCWTESSLAYLKSIGVTHIWFMDIPRHATGEDFVKGDPGSPYAVSDWYDINPYLADEPDRRKQEFRELLRRVHDAGLKCLIDFIPNHVAVNYKGKLGVHGWHDGDWTDTRKVDFGVADTVPEFKKILNYWAEMGVDGFRCDMVELVPAGILGEIIASVKARYPQLLFVAETYDRGNYAEYLDVAGFDLLYDKSGSYDILRGIMEGRRSARELTSNWQSLGARQASVLNFLENHDEQRIASPFFAGDPSRAYAALGFGLLFNNASYMLYFGQEAGEDAAEGHEGRTSIFNWSNPSGVGRILKYIKTKRWDDVKVKSLFGKYRELLRLAGRKVFSEGRNWDLCYCNMDTPGFDPDRHFAFMRYNGRETWICLCNFSDRMARVKLTIPEELKHLCPACPEIEVQAYDIAVLRLR